MGDLFKNLVEVMESHLGKFGRPLVTLLCISAFLGLFAWFTKLFWDNLAYPVGNWVIGRFDEGYFDWEVIKHAIIPFAVYLVLIGIAILIVYLVYENKKKSYLS